MALQQPQSAPARFRFTAALYERMIASGILGEDDRVELIDGEIIAMSPMGARHADGIIVADELLHERIGREARIMVQCPIRLSDESEPEPDLAVLRRRSYRRTLPTAADVLLVIEIADSSRDFDRTIKLPLYAANGIPEAWLIDLAAETIERHTAPVEGRYTMTLIARRGQRVESLSVPQLTLAPDEFFG